MKIFIIIRTAFLLVCSNTFMTFAWYSHLRNWSDKKWYIAAILSWGIALFEYLLQVPANRIGSYSFTTAQLKIIQEVITLVEMVSRMMVVMRSHYPIASSSADSRGVPQRRQITAESGPTKGRHCAV